MVKVSGSGGYYDNGRNSSAPQDTQKTKKNSQSTFVTYQEFKKQAEAEYQAYKDSTYAEYEKYKNDAEEEYNKFKSAVEMSQKGFEDTDGTPVENPLVTGPPEGTDPEYDRLVKGEGVYQYTKSEIVQRQTGLPIEKIPHLEKDENGNLVNNYYDSAGKLIKSVPHNASNPTTPENEADISPGADVKPAVPVTPQAEPTVPQTKPQEEEAVREYTQVSRKGVTGKYSITPGKDGTGFSLATKMNVSMNGEARKFFTHNNTPGNEVMYDDKTQLYSFRGIESSRQSFLQSRMNMASQNVSINNAIYNDLIEKQKNGTELNDAEKSFIKYHLENLQKYNLGIDGNGNIIDKSK